MLNFALKGTYQDASGYSWDYYRDDQLDPNPDPNAFYILPKPQYVMNANKPSIGISTFQTSGPDNGMGVFRFDVELSVPADIESQISGAIMANPTKFPKVTRPNFISLALLPGSTANFTLQTDTPVTFTAQASNYGSNVASFLIKLTSNQLTALKAVLVNAGGAFDLSYNLSVPARLQGVSAVLSFNSSIAYQYQVTQPTYDSWGDQTSPGSAEGLLKDSASSDVAITWGISNPPQTLVKDVTTWANNTLTSLVTAEVEKVIKVQGMQSDQSFSINEVSSFTNTYSENMVVNWQIQPTATLPSFPQMGLNIQDFEEIVNTQKQYMTVSANIPFVGDNVSQGLMLSTAKAGDISNPVLVESVDITVHYPTLTGGQTTFTLKNNGSQVVVTDFDTTQGEEWSLDYAVNYQQHPQISTAPTVRGNVPEIDMGTYTLEVQECGVLTVTFDAQQAFKTEGLQPIEIDVNFSYVSDQDNTPVEQIVKFYPASPIQTLTSLQPFPINKAYNYQVTYVYQGSVLYIAPLVQNRTGSQQIIGAADAMRSVNLIVFEPVDQANNDPLLEVTINMWYDGVVNVPDSFVTTLPTKASPAVFTLTPDPDSKGNLIARKVFVGLSTADQPLVYSATADFGSGEVDIPAQPIQNTQPSILVNSTQRYYTVEINPAAIAWNSAPYSSVEVLITPTVTSGSTQQKNVQAQQAFTWNKGETGNKYITIGIQSGNAVSYICEVNYIVPGTATKTFTSTALTDVIFNIPPTSPA